MSAWPGITEQRRLEWEAERRFLARELQRIQSRLREIEEMIAAFWPERVL